VGIGVAPVGPAAGRRLPKHNLPGALRATWYQPARTHVGLPRRRGGHHRCRAVGTLAFASVLYRPHDVTFAARLLEAARAGYRFLRDRPAEDSDGPTCPAMRQDGDAGVGRNVLMYAAAGLLLATGDRRLRADFEESYQPLQNDPNYLRSNVFAALLYLVPRATRSDSGPSVGSSAVVPRRCAWTASITPSNGLVVPSGAPKRAGLLG
jgi:hypothetical protein